ncbi:deaminase [Lithospermum erythrorhizon]|uniref:tRNA(adenine(34)) deaminase n=1 Tax=Lithospermum erythrorhizon TaxID=34254 RepID=A0AAV3PJH4_LITER
MQNMFLSSNFSRKCDGQLSFWLNDYTCCLNDRFCRYPFEHTSSSLVSCCVNANLCVCKVPITPVYLCGLRQCSLIQYRPCKRVIFSRLSGSNVNKGSNFEKCRSRKGRMVSLLPGWNVDMRFNFEEDFDFREKSVCRCMVYEESGEEYGLEDSIDDEAEVMLSLLTEEVSEECLDVRRRDGRRHKKIVMEERENVVDQCEACGSKKKVNSGVLRNRSKFEYEPVVNKPRDGVDRTEEETELSLPRGHRRNSVRREDKDELLRGRLRKHERDELLRASRMKEREDTLIENHTASARKEHKENLSRIEEHKQRLRKDGSSCTSYYSLSSMGEFGSDGEIQERQDEFGEELSSEYERDSGRLEEVKLEGKTGRHDGYQEDERHVLKKGKTIEGEELMWHKESEKELTDMSIEELRFRKGLVVHDDVSRKASYKKYEGQEEKATSMVKSNDERRERRLTIEEVEPKTETIKNYKQFKEHSEGYGANLASSSNSWTLLSQREDNSATESSSLKEKRKEHEKKAGLIIREDAYEKSGTHAQSSKHQKLDIRKTTSSEIISENAPKDQKKDSSTVVSSVHDAKEKHYHRGLFSAQIDSRKASQQLTEEVDIQTATVFQRQSELDIQKQEERSSLVYGSYHEPTKSTRANVGVGKSDSKTTQRTITSLGNNRDSGRNDADQRIRIKYDTVVTPPSSQPMARGSLHAGSASGLANEEVGHYSSHEDPDALSSADLLQKSSSYHVGEFMEKVRHDMSSSEIQNEKMTHETKMEHDFKKNEQQAVTEVGSGGSQLKEQSGGPSVEMWDVDEPSNQEHPGAAVLDRNSAGSVITKRAGRSLWNVISDIVRFPWALRSTNQSQMSKSGEKSSPNQSTSSTAWFSGNEPDENIQECDINRKGSASQESISGQIPKEQKVRLQSQGGSSSSKDQIRPFEEKSLSYAEVSARDTSSGSDFPTLGEGTSLQQAEFIVSGASMAAGSSQLPAIRLRRSAYIVGESSASKKVDVSGGGEIVQTKLPVSTDASEISQPEGKYGEQKSRKLLRTIQVERERFEKWEEAYRIEAEKRKMDEMFMREALLEARKAADSWEVPVGAVLVHDGNIIARGHNLVEELRDSTAHAEMICIREASNILRTWRLSDTTLYVTLEPCAMCAGAILQARIDVIVWGAPNKLLGADGSWISLFPNGEGDNNMNPSDKPAAPVHPFHPNIQIRRNVLASECADSMQQFFQLRRKKQKKQEPPSPPSCLPIVNHPSKFLTKMHDAFHMMFCL